jgi:hypothetical protein
MARQLPGEVIHRIKIRIESVKKDGYRRGRGAV